MGKCEIITGERRSGKTTKLIELAAGDHRHYIVCANEYEADRISNEALRMHKMINRPITFHAFLRGHNRGLEGTRYFMDNAEFFFGWLNIDAITMTLGNDNNTN